MLDLLKSKIVWNINILKKVHVLKKVNYRKKVHVLKKVNYRHIYEQFNLKRFSLKCAIWRINFLNSLESVIFEHFEKWKIKNKFIFKLFSGFRHYNSGCGHNMQGRMASLLHSICQQKMPNHTNFRFAQSKRVMTTVIWWQNDRGQVQLNSQ